jgi:D-glycero-alpha-D-manno-heptose-7-phosphate kinase
MNPHRTVIAQASIRVDFTTGLIDVPPFSDDFPGRSVNAAISLYTYAEGYLREDEKIRLVSQDKGIVVEADSLEDLRLDGRLDLVKGIVRKLAGGFGIEIRTKSDAPPGGSRLGASGALGVAVVGLIDALLNTKMTKSEIAEVAAQSEREIGIAGGRQDQYAAALGGIHFLEFHGPEAVVQRLDIPNNGIKLLEEHLLLAYPGGSYDSGDLVTQVMTAYRSGDKKVRSHLLTQNELALEIREALVCVDLKRLSELLKEVHLHQRELLLGLIGPSTSPRVEKILSIMSQIGVDGCKATGGGGPGACLLFLCPPSLREQAIDLLKKAGCQIFPFTIDMKGLRTYVV